METKINFQVVSQVLKWEIVSSSSVVGGDKASSLKKIKEWSSSSTGRSSPRKLNYYFQEDFHMLVPVLEVPLFQVVRILLRNVRYTRLRTIPSRRLQTSKMEDRDIFQFALI